MKQKELLGTVVWFDNSRGYGFVQPDKVYKLEKDIFVHWKSIIKKESEYATLSRGDIVSFKVSKMKKRDGTIKPMAIKVQKIASQ